MLFRSMMMAGGIAGAAAFPQFPEYSQQYSQRLARAVDELLATVEMFDAGAAALNMSREEACDFGSALSTAAHFDVIRANPVSAAGLKTRLAEQMEM